jgi:hypothetical protein
MDMALFVPKRDTLVTYYILPLCGANKKTFGNAFRSSYISKNGYNVYIKLGRRLVTPHYKSDPQYRTEVIIDGDIYLIYQVHLDHIRNLDLFREGRYSEFSKEAKKIIYKTSTLPYNKSSDSHRLSHPILQALSRHKALRKYLEDFLGVKEIPGTNELIDKPSEDWYIESKTKKDDK